MVTGMVANPFGACQVDRHMIQPPMKLIRIS